MDGRSVTAGGLGQTLRGATSGSGQMHAHFLGAENFNQRAQDGGLPHARSAGNDGDFALQGAAQGFALQFMIGKAGFLLSPLYCGINLDRRQTTGDFAKSRDHIRDLLFSPVVVR